MSSRYTQRKQLPPLPLPSERRRNHDHSGISLPGGTSESYMTRSGPSNRMQRDVHPATLDETSYPVNRGEQPNVYALGLSGTTSNINVDGFRESRSEASSRAAKRQTLRVQYWLYGEQKLTKSWQSHAPELALDIFLVLLPIVFFVLAFGALQLHGQPISQFGTDVLKLQRLAPTLFPIVFSMVVGVFMSTLARWNGQKGCELGLLEQLVGSQSFGAAAERFILLRRLHPLSFIILVLWALSPLGGQSALRVLTTGPSIEASSFPLRYLRTSSLYHLSQPSTTQESQEQGFFFAALLSSSKVKTSPMDVWGNVKVPMIETLEDGSDIITGGNEWHDITTLSPYNYSSLAGILIAGLPTHGISNFSIQTTYPYINCSDWIHFPFGNGSSLLPRLYDHVKPIVGYNLKSLTASFQRGNGGDVERGKMYFVVEADTPTGSDRKFYFIKNFEYPHNDMSNPPGSLVSSCSLSATWVESEVQCRGISCAVQRIRRSRLTHSPQIYTSRGPENSVNEQHFQELLSAFVYFGASVLIIHPTPTPIVEYLAGNDGNLFAQENYASGEGIRWTSFANVTSRDFSVRFTQLWNLLLEVASSASWLEGGFSSNLTVYDIPPNEARGVFRSFPNVASTGRVQVESAEIYLSDSVFVAILLAITLIMELCAIINLVLKCRCKAPDILGYVSSMTRENPHFPLPPGGSTLDGIERSRYLSKTRVQLADVQPGKPVGRIELRALEVLSLEEQVLGRLDKKGKDRLYL